MHNVFNIKTPNIKLQNLTLKKIVYITNPDRHTGISSIQHIGFRRMYSCEKFIEETSREKISNMGMQHISKSASTHTQWSEFNGMRQGKSIVIRGSSKTKMETVN